VFLSGGNALIQNNLLNLSSLLKTFECQVLEKKLETEQHFLLHCEAYRHLRKGLVLEYVSWDAALRDSQIDSTPRIAAKKHTGTSGRDQY